MFKLCLVNALVVALLACPFKCMSGFAFTDASIEVPVTGCACCRGAPDCESADEKSEHRDERHSDDCRCVSCVCQGATLSTPNIKFDSVAQAYDVVSLICVKTLGCRAANLNSFGVSNPLASNFSGSFVRIAHRSLQI